MHSPCVGVGASVLYAQAEARGQPPVLVLTFYLETGPLSCCHCRKQIRRPKGFWGVSLLSSLKV